MEYKTVTWKLPEFPSRFQNLKALAQLGLTDPMNEGVTTTLKRIERRVDRYRKMMRAAFDWATPKVVENYSTGALSVGTDRDKNPILHPGRTLDDLQKMIDKINSEEVTFQIAVVDAKHLDATVGNVTSAMKVGCDFMLTNCPWHEDDDGDMPFFPELAEFMPESERPEPEGVEE